MLSQEKAFDDRDEWRLLADELSLLPGMTDTWHLGFALQLKIPTGSGPLSRPCTRFPFRHCAHYR